MHESVRLALEAGMTRDDFIRSLNNEIAECEMISRRYAAEIAADKRELIEIDRQLIALEIKLMEGVVYRYDDETDVMRIEIGDDFSNPELTEHEMFVFRDDDKNVHGVVIPHYESYWTKHPEELSAILRTHDIFHEHRRADGEK